MRRHEISSRFDQIVDFSGLHAFVDEPVGHLSSGMYMRLAFAVGAFLESEILLVDEVLAVGDAKFQEKCLGTMRDAANSGRTVIFVSHSMAAISQLTTRALVLEQGGLAFNGSTELAIERYIKQKAQDQFTGLYPVEELVCQKTYRANEQLRICRMGLAPGLCDFYSGAAFAFDFEIEAQSDFKALRLALTLNTMTGQPIVTILGPDFDLPPGRHLRRLSVHQLPIAPGLYDFSVHLGIGQLTGSKKELDLYAGFGRLKVPETLPGGQIIEGWRRLWGAVYADQANWETIQDNEISIGKK